MNRVSGNQNGVALVVALIMLLVLTLLGISAVSTTTFETNIVGNQRVYNGAFYAAECGIEEFRLSPPVTRLEDSLDFTSYRSVGDGCSYRFRSDRIGYGVEGGNRFHIFKVTSEGIAPNFPVSGKVTLEAVIDVLDTTPEGYN